MLNPWYIAAVLVTGFAITFSLRAVPFAILKPLRESKFVEAFSTWMPAGILVILALSTFVSSSGGQWERLVPAAVATAVTVGVHLLAKRRTLLSVGAGTLTYVLMVNFL